MPDSETAFQGSESPPSLETVAQLIEPMRARYKRSTRKVTWIAVGICALLGCVLGAGTQDAEPFAFGLGFVAWLFTRPICWLMLNDLYGIDRIVRTGKVYPATLSVSLIDGLAAGAIAVSKAYEDHNLGALRTVGATKSYCVRWTESGRSCSARFEAFDFQPPVRQVAVVASSSHRIAIVLNGKLYGAKRGIL